MSQGCTWNWDDQETCAAGTLAKPVALVCTLCYQETHLGLWDLVTTFWHRDPGRRRDGAPGGLAHHPNRCAHAAKIHGFGCDPARRGLCNPICETVLSTLLQDGMARHAR